MTRAEIANVMGTYREYFERNNVSKRFMAHNALPATRDDILAHCHATLDEMEEILADGRKMEKFHRWLGFMQGVLWAEGIYTLSDLRNHNRASA